MVVGPWGRRLCFEVLAEFADPGHQPPWLSFERIDFGRAERELHASVQSADLGAIAALEDESSLLPALDRAVGSATYWQELNPDDQFLSTEGVAHQLSTVADAISKSPAAAWWATPLATEAQHVVQHEIDDLGERNANTPPEMTGMSERIASWRAEAVEKEGLYRKQPRNPNKAMGGSWWSTPIFGSIDTARTVDCVPVGLSLVEDAFNWTTAYSWAVAVRPGMRIFEINSEDDWTHLVSTYPFDVSRSRRGVWFSLTGRDGPWLIPDWMAVSAEYDAVHLSVGAYLSSAGRAIEVGEASTVLAGWGPDATWWLTDALEIKGPVVRWNGDSDDPLSWAADAGPVAPDQAS